MVYLPQTPYIFILKYSIYSMSSLYCEYHPDRPAVEKCYRCQRLICLADRNNLRQYQSSFSSDFYANNIPIISLCPLCYYDSAVEGKNLLKNYTGTSSSLFGFIFLIPVIFVLFFLLMMNMISDGLLFDNSIFYIIIVPPAFIAIIGLFLSKSQACQGSALFRDMPNRNVKKAKTIKNKFLSSIESSKILKEINEAELTCFECGDKLEIDALYCMNCGDPTDEERKHFNITE